MQFCITVGQPHTVVGHTGSCFEDAVCAQLLCFSCFCSLIYYNKSSKVGTTEWEITATALHCKEGEDRQEITVPVGLIESRSCRLKMGLNVNLQALWLLMCFYLYHHWLSWTFIVLLAIQFKKSAVLLLCYMVKRNNLIVFNPSSTSEYYEVHVWNRANTQCFFLFLHPALCVHVGACPCVALARECLFVYSVMFQPNTRRANARACVWICVRALRRSLC